MNNNDYINIFNDFKLKTFLKNQNEFNMILNNDINKLNTIIKTQETKINDIYDNIYYICIGIFLIIILI